MFWNIPLPSPSSTPDYSQMLIVAEEEKKTFSTIGEANISIPCPCGLYSGQFRRYIRLARLRVMCPIVDVAVSSVAYKYVVVKFRCSNRHV